MAIFTVRLDGGREIRASSVHNSETYGGMFEGDPDAQYNQILLAKMKNAVQRLFPLVGEVPVVVVDPAREVHPNQTDDLWGPAEYLPSYWLAGYFDSRPVNEAGHGSSAVVVWFQDDPGPSPSASVLTEIQKLDWSTIARDYEY